MEAKDLKKIDNLTILQMDLRDLTLEDDAKPALGFLCDLELAFGNEDDFSLEKYAEYISVVKDIKSMDDFQVCAGLSAYTLFGLINSKWPNVVSKEIIHELKISIIGIV
jgi:hypothetical protein